MAERQGIVEIFRILRVDGHGKHLAEVFARRDFLLRYFIGNKRGEFLYIFGIAEGEVVLRQNGMHFGVVVARLAEDVDDPPHGVIDFFGPFDDLCDYFVSILAAVEGVLRNEDVVRENLAVEHHKGEMFIQLQRAHEARFGPLEDFDHRALGIGALAFGE